MYSTDLPLILVTNDDGLQAHGIQALIRTLQPFGQLLVVAPDSGQSGQSHAVTMKDPLYLKKISETDTCVQYTCSGTAADCVKLGVNHLTTRKPDFLVSGINHGTNSAISVVYSGTMAAAIEGCMHGIPSVGFSHRNHYPGSDIAIGREWAGRVFSMVLQHGLPRGVCLNVNFPDISPEACQGIKLCRQADSAWIEKFDQRRNPRGHDYYWLTGDFYNYEPEATDTDEWALNHGYISIVPTRIDFTAHEHIQPMRFWESELKQIIPLKN